VIDLRIDLFAIGFASVPAPMASEPELLVRVLDGWPCESITTVEAIRRRRHSCISK
jgi:hypothetical protein